MTWGEITDDATTWAGSAATTLTWADDTASDTTLRNSSRFIAFIPKEDASGGKDFGLSITSVNPFVISSADPRRISADTLNDPTF